MKTGAAIWQGGVCALVILCAAFVPLAQCQAPSLINAAAATGAVDLEGGTLINLDQVAGAATAGGISEGVGAFSFDVEGGFAEGTFGQDAASQSSRGGAALASVFGDGTFEEGAGAVSTFTNALTGESGAASTVSGEGTDFELASVATAVGTNPDCAAAVSFCSTCTVSGGAISCTGCQAGYYLSGGACPSCSAAIANCATCALTSAITGLECSTCATGFTLSADKKSCTTASPSPTTSPSPSPSTSTSPSPSTSTTPSPSTCTIDDCETCTTNSAGVEECTKCEDGDYLDKDEATDVNDACKPCPDNCKTCEENFLGQVECLTCDDGYKLNEARRCVRCTDLDPECQDCEIRNSILSCTDCTTGFQLTTAPADWCVVCAVNNCAVCQLDNTDQCDQCRPGFPITQGTGGAADTCG